MSKRNSEVKKKTVKGLVQWDKGVSIVVTGYVTVGKPLYAVQERDDGTTLQYNLKDKVRMIGGTSGTIVTVDLPDDMLEETGTITLYEQDAEYTADDVECTAIIKCPITERPYPVDQEPPEPPTPSEDIALYYNALNQEISGDEFRKVFTSDSNQSIITFGGANLYMRDVKTVKLQMLPSSSVTITKKNQPFFIISSPNSAGWWGLAYPEELKGKMQLTVEMNDGVVYAMNVNTSSWGGKSEVYGTETLYVEIGGLFDDSGNRLKSSLIASKVAPWMRAFWVAFGYNNYGGYPFLPSNL